MAQELVVVGNFKLLQELKVILNFVAVKLQLLVVSVMADMDIAVVKE